jgi:hypothetical protein
LSAAASSCAIAEARAPLATQAFAVFGGGKPETRKQRGNRLGIVILELAARDDEVTGKVERSDRTSARKMYAMRECMLKHDIG